jgi:hypothetical protein
MQVMQKRLRARPLQPMLVSTSFAVKATLSAMHRLTTRLLLVLLLVDILAPMALAISAPPPHACCVRKPLHGPSSRSLELQAVGGQHRNCCPPVITAHWAEPGSGIGHGARPLLTYLPPELAPLFRTNAGNALHPVRGPPLS